MIKTPVSLLERLRSSKDSSAWHLFASIYTPFLYKQAQHLNLQIADAADLVQEVLLVAFHKLPSFQYDPKGSFRKWLVTIARNKWILNYRRCSPQVGIALPDVPAPDEREELEEKEYRYFLVRQALSNIQSGFPITTWTAFQEYALAGLPAHQVAARLGLTINSVYVAKSRVLKRLRDELAGLLD